jgi:hypothetical protein
MQKLSAHAARTKTEKKKDADGPPATLNRHLDVRRMNAAAAASIFDQNLLI